MLAGEILFRTRNFSCIALCDSCSTRRNSCRTYIYARLPIDLDLFKTVLRHGFSIDDKPGYSITRLIPIAKIRHCPVTVLYIVEN